MTAAPDDLITVGAIVGVYGVRGWVRVRSYTDPMENILTYPEWLIGREGAWQPIRLLEGRRQGKGLVAALEGIGDREQAKGLMHAEVAVRRAELPALPEGEYYWCDLEGLRVETIDGQTLGVVDHLMATGANDVLVVRGDRERLIPFLPDRVVASVDWDAGLIRVEWDPSF